MASKEEKKIGVSRPSTVEKNLAKKWTTLGVVGVVAIVVLVLLANPQKKQIVQNRQQPQNITLGNFQEADWVARAQAEVREANAKAEKITGEAQGLRTQLDSQNQVLKELSDSMNEMRAAMEEQRRGDARLSQELEEVRRRPVAPANVTPPPGEGEDDEDGFVPPPLPRDGKFEDAMREGGLAPGTQGQTGAGTGTRRRAGDAPIVLMAQATTGGPTPVRSTFKKNPYAGFLPAGSFAEGVLLFGVDAGASEVSRTNPSPVIIRISENAFTPGDSRYRLESCSAIGEVYGDLSSERAYIRVTRISCLDVKNKLVLETAVTGVVVDSDGTMGLRGTVERRNGQIIAKGAVAGIAQGIASIGQTVSQAASQSFSAPVSGGTQVSSSSVDPQRLAEAGAFGGARNAADRIAEIYLKEASQIFPVVAVPPGRKVTVSFVKGAQLTWDTLDGVFKREVRPESR